MSSLSRSHSPSAIRSLAHKIGAAYQTMLQEMDYRRASSALNLLGDDVLHDIGVTRGDIEIAVRQGRTGLSA